MSNAPRLRSFIVRLWGPLVIAFRATNYIFAALLVLIVIAGAVKGHVLLSARGIVLGYLLLFAIMFGLPGVLTPLFDTLLRLRSGRRQQ